MNLSVAMTTYNGEPYLDAQLDSIGRQVRTPEEIVVCDDGSSDRTLDILADFARVAPCPVRILRNPRRLGYSANFARAIGETRGDVVLLSDQDDVWFPDRTEVVAAAFRSTATPIVLIHDAELADGELRPLGMTKLGQTLSAGLGADSFITGCCTAIAGSLRPLILPIPQEHFAHDAWIHAIGKTLGCRRLIDTPHLYYRRHGRNTSDGLTSRTSRVTFRHMLMHYGPRDSRAACARRLNSLDVLETRLVEVRARAEGLFGTEVVASALRRLERERAVVRRRASLLESGRLSRPLAAWRLFQDGGYEYFSGWKSFAKDLIR